MLAKSLAFRSGAYAAGVVLATKAPMIPSNCAGQTPRPAFCAVAPMLTKAGRERPIKALA
ncbi:hypothetical protein QFZ42_000814 [Variovorax paradoxus]|nr:hypothetical protein [Variovorax paradoxus]